ncbi:MAG: hypothetical protein D3924_13005 [Candidatus Electrothrix sp. AR4]|nr:hypothetical protein [Candidatus Electrothrix sp. AR4]
MYELIVLESGIITSLQDYRQLDCGQLAGEKHDLSITNQLVIKVDFWVPGLDKIVLRYFQYFSLHKQAAAPWHDNGKQ